MESQHDLKQALEWATDKTLALDTENQRLKGQIGRIRAALISTTVDSDAKIAQISRILYPPKDDDR